MKLLYLITALLSFGVNDIAKVNALKTEAQSAYEKGDFEKALEIYQTLTDSLDASSDEILLNMGHAYYQLNDTSNAQYTYQKLSDADNQHVKSVALQQLGVMSDKPENSKLALNYFKEAIKADPSNEEARYNYEVLKKKIKEQEEQDKKDQKDQNKDQEDQDKEEEKEDKEKEQKSKEEQEKEGDQNKEEEQKDKDGEKGEEEKQEKDQKGDEQKEGEEGKEEQKEGEEKEGDQKKGEEKEEEGKESEPKDGEEKEGEESKQPKSTEQKLKELNISPQQAKMILEAMKNQEVQYLQQQRRKATKRKNSGKPDW